MKADPLKPGATLLVKLASVSVHAEELMGPGGHSFDQVALVTVLNDPEVVAWVKEMTAMGFAPVKRS